MIRSIRNKALKRYFETGKSDKLPVQGAANIARLGRILLALDAASKPDDLNLPGFHFHGLEGEERWSVRVTANYRLTFAWEAPDAIAVDLEDYH